MNGPTLNIVGQDASTTERVSTVSFRGTRSWLNAVRSKFR